ncbi:hypothetical protein DIPPA_17480 [Diplonema papillatum]|nr:hypothetical protein DIPPA_17480 [Diplonema papillatum]
MWWGETKKQAHTYSKCARREGRDGESSPDVKKRLLVPPPAATSAWAREADAEMWERVSARYPDRRDAGRTPTPPPALPLPMEEYAPSSKSSLAACYGFGTNIIRRWGETKKQAHTYSKCARREGRDGESSPDVKKRLLVPPPAATSAWAREADAEMWERVSARYPDRRDAGRTPTPPPALPLPKEEYAPSSKSSLAACYGFGTNIIRRTASSAYGGGRPRSRRTRIQSAREGRGGMATDVKKRLLVPPPAATSAWAREADAEMWERVSARYPDRRDAGRTPTPPPALPLPKEEYAPSSKSSLAACYGFGTNIIRRWGETKKQAHTYSKCARREGRDGESSPDVKKRLLVPPPAATSAWAREADAEMWERVSARYPDRRDAARRRPSRCRWKRTRRWGETKKQAHTYSKCARREGRDGESSPDVKKRLLVPPPAATSAWAREADAEMWERVSARYPDRRDAARRRPSRCRWKRTRRRGGMASLPPDVKKRLLVPPPAATSAWAREADAEMWERVSARYPDRRDAARRRPSRCRWKRWGETKKQAHTYSKCARREGRDPAGREEAAAGAAACCDFGAWAREADAEMWERVSARYPDRRDAGRTPTPPPALPLPKEEYAPSSKSSLAACYGFGTNIIRSTASSAYVYVDRVRPSTSK